MTEYLTPCVNVIVRNVPNYTNAEKYILNCLFTYDIYELESIDI